MSAIGKNSTTQEPAEATSVEASELLELFPWKNPADVFGVHIPSKGLMDQDPSSIFRSTIRHYCLANRA